MAFSSGRTEAISTFAYSDIATGKVVVNHYGGYTSGAYLLSKNIFWSDGIETILGSDTFNFDLEFTRPRTVQGDMIVNVPVIVDEGGSTVYISITIQKISGGVPITLIGPKLTKWNSPEGSVGKYVAHASMVNLEVPRTKFKTEDTLRVIVTVIPGAQQTGIGHDPKNRTWSLTIDAVSEDAPTQMMVQIPFKIDV